MPDIPKDFVQFIGRCPLGTKKKGTMKEQQKLATLLLLLAILKAKLIAPPACHRERRNVASEKEISHAHNGPAKKSLIRFIRIL
jgi:hypothetical protein